MSLSSLKIVWCLTCRTFWQYRFRVLLPQRKLNHVEWKQVHSVSWHLYWRNEPGTKSIKQPRITAVTDELRKAVAWKWVWRVRDNDSDCSRGLFASLEIMFQSNSWVVCSLTVARLPSTFISSIVSLRICQPQKCLVFNRQDFLTVQVMSSVTTEEIKPHRMRAGP